MILIWFLNNNKHYLVSSVSISKRSTLNGFEIRINGFQIFRMRKMIIVLPEWISINRAIFVEIGIPSVPLMMVNSRFSQRISVVIARWTVNVISVAFRWVPATIWLMRNQPIFSASSLKLKIATNVAVISTPRSDIFLQ